MKPVQKSVIQCENITNLMNVVEKINQMAKCSVYKKDEINVEYSTEMMNYLMTGLVAITVLVSIN